MPISSLPEPILDDLRFQKDLVDEARRRIIRYCPDWTDYNISDPGITLIELFAWMTEMLTYRLNLVPGKNYIRFLDLLGLQLKPASCATTELTFRLSVPLPLKPEDDTFTVVPQGLEVATRRTEDEAEIIFSTDERLLIAPPQLAHLRREEEVNKNYLPRLGIEPFYAFDRTPRPGNTFYIGFDDKQSLAGYLLQLRFTSQAMQATGVRRDDPPWVWEFSTGVEQWMEIAPSERVGERDSTGGLNNAEGRVMFYLPLSFSPSQVHGRNGYWLRCRFEQRRPEQGTYTQSPRITALQAFVMRSTVRATNAVVVTQESLGVSNGEQGQLFKLGHAPALTLRADETLEIEEISEGELVFVAWKEVEDFAHSTRYDRHFTLNTTTGEIRLGPGVRQSDGSMRQYGRVPESGRQLRFSCYRYGGGSEGNVPIDRIQLLKTTVPYIDSVTNLVRATGGRDQESLDEAKQRARREVRAQQRAVTADDFEHFALSSGRSVARVRCNPFNGRASAKDALPGTVDLLVVPAAMDAIRVGDLSRLRLDSALRDELTRYLDQYRLLTVNLRVREPVYIGVKVSAEIVLTSQSLPEAVRGRVHDALAGFLSPLDIGTYLPADEGERAQWTGWPFGRDLYVAELYALIQNVPGVKYVRDVKLGAMRIDLGKLSPNGSGSAMTSALVISDQRLVEVPPDGLICSLEHEIKVVTL